MEINKQAYDCLLYTSGEMSCGDRPEQFFDVVDGKNILKIIDKNQKQDMLLSLIHI